MHRRDPDAGRCAGDQVAAHIFQFRFNKSDSFADLHNPALPDHLARLAGGQKLHVEVDCRWKELCIGRNQNSWPHTIIEHGSQKSTLHVARCVAEFRPRFEGDPHPSFLSFGLQDIKSKQPGARWRGKPIKDSWNGHKNLLPEKLGSMMALLTTLCQ